MAWPTVADRVLVFDVEIFGREDATERVCRVGDFDFNLVFRVKAKDVNGTLATLDVSGATSWTLVAIDPDGLRASFTLTNRDAANGLVEDLVVTGTLDVEGPWQLYVDIDWDGASQTSTNRGILHVEGANYKAPEKKNLVEAFSVISSPAPNAAAADKILYLKNDRSAETFVVDSILVDSVENVLWKLWNVTGTSAGSSALTPEPMDTENTRDHGLTSRGDGAITGLTEDGQIGAVRTLANDSAVFPIAGNLRIGSSKAIAVEYDTGTTGKCEAHIIGHFE